MSSLSRFIIVEFRVSLECLGVLFEEVVGWKGGRRKLNHVGFGWGLSRDDLGRIWTDCVVYFGGENYPIILTRHRKVLLD